MRNLTDERLEEYLRIHEQQLPELAREPLFGVDGQPATLLFRMALSCLVDADHSDTASNYGDEIPGPAPLLRPRERLAALDQYVATLGQDEVDEKRRNRNRLRAAIYSACRHADVTAPMVECDSPVGSGKTTAIMAHLLHAAHEKNLRRVFIVLPYTTIIQQSVGVYRSKALVLEREHPEQVIAEHHHRAEFQHADSRLLSVLWCAPIVVTTAVQFFETLAGRHPARIRKLHQLPGSAIFIDESHAALPAHLWPQAWKWLYQLAHEWGCHIVLGSGSLNRLWNLEEVIENPIVLPELVSPAIQQSASEGEQSRIHYASRPDPLSVEDLRSWLDQLLGPRLLIVNTVQTAAVVARDLETHLGRAGVEHLSTALAPRHRGQILARVKLRLLDPEDTNWTLVATSCMESGVDVSFRSGLRERSSLSSLIQIGGRVNRSSEYGTAVVWDFQLRQLGLITTNPAFERASRVLAELFRQGRVISPELCTEALQMELQLQGKEELNRDLRHAENEFKFKDVEDMFRVIDAPSVTVVIDKSLEQDLDNGNKVNWRELQQLSVQIYKTRIDDFGLSGFPYHPKLYRWPLEYDPSFLGYMSGVLQLRDIGLTGFIV